MKILIRRENGLSNLRGTAMLLALMVCLFLTPKILATVPACVFQTGHELPDIPASAAISHQFDVSCELSERHVACAGSWSLSVENQSDNSIELKPPEGWFGKEFSVQSGKKAQVVWNGLLHPEARAGFSGRHMLISRPIFDEGVIEFSAKSPSQHRVTILIRADSKWKIESYGSTEAESDKNPLLFSVPPFATKSRCSEPHSGIELVRTNQWRTGGPILKGVFHKHADEDSRFFASVGYEVTYAQWLAASLSVDFGDSSVMVVPGASLLWATTGMPGGFEVGVGMPIAVHSQFDLAARIFLEMGFAFLGAGVGVDFWAGFGEAKSKVDLLYFIRLSL